MKRLAFAVVVLGALVGICSANILTKIDITTAAGNATIAVANNTTVYTKSTDNIRGDNFGCFVLMDNTGTSNGVKIQTEYCKTRPNEGVADTVNCTIPSTASDVVTALTDKTLQLYTFNPYPSPYRRYKITGPTDATTDTTLSIQEQIISQDATGYYDANGDWKVR